MLRLLGEGEDSSTPPLPSPAEVLYVGPRPDGSRRNCDDCFLWVRGNRCLIHGPDLEVRASQICGYWVGGTPYRRWPEGQGKIEYVDSRTSGLVSAPEGSACDNCVRFLPGEPAHCAAVYVQGKPAQVDPKGCCSRWLARR